MLVGPTTAVPPAAVARRCRPPLPPSLPFALGIAGSIRVGTLLGGNRPREARRATGVLLALTTGGALATAAGFLLARRHIGRAFTTDADVVRKIARWWGGQGGRSDLEGGVNGSHERRSVVSCEVLF